MGIDASSGAMRCGMKPIFIYGEPGECVMVKINDGKVAVDVMDQASEAVAFLDSLAVETLIRALSIALLEIKRGEQ